jgi:hypothetical protein
LESAVDRFEHVPIEGLPAYGEFLVRRIVDVGIAYPLIFVSTVN